MLVRGRSVATSFRWPREVIIPADQLPSSSAASASTLGESPRQWRLTPRSLTIVLAATTALVLARSAVFLWWEQAGFDADQAVYGLMAKHIAEGRAFPMFAYSFQYMLAVQAWITAPLLLVFPATVGVIKIPVVLINIVTGGLLVWLLHRDGGLRPVTALVSSLFYVLATPALAASLVETGGANPEPFLYVLLLWLLRGRPLAFGIVFGIGFLHREFTVYGLIAIVVLALLDDRRITGERVRAAALAAVGYMIVWELVRTGFLFSTPFGPGTPISAPLGGGDNLEGLAGRGCWAPQTIIPGLAGLFGNYLGIPFGADNNYLSEFGIRSLARARLPGMPAFWPVLGVVFAVVLARVLWISVATRSPIWRGRAAIGAFVLLIGLQSGAAYALGRCGELEAVTFRYALLTVYAGIGVVVLFFIYEPRREWRWAMTGLIICWAAVSAASHLRLLNEYIYAEPQNPRRELATYLVTNGIRYAWADYWTAYATTFLAEEKVVIASTEVIRITSYQNAVEAHRAEAVTVQQKPCGSTGGTEVVSGMYWVCHD